RLKDIYAKKGEEDISVYVDCKISINGSPYKQLINPEVDLTSVTWDPFKHCEWIMPQPKLRDKKVLSAKKAKEILQPFKASFLSLSHKVLACLSNHVSFLFKKS